MPNRTYGGALVLSRLLLLTILLLSTLMPAQAERPEHGVDAWRPLNYDVTLTLNNQLTGITAARTEITALVLKEPLAALDLDFGQLPVDSVTVGGAPARYEQRPGTLSISLARAAKRGERLSVAVAYHGRPQDGLSLLPDKDGKPSVTGDNWPDRVHHWIPCLDHPSAKATVRFTVTAPARDLVVANGQLETTRPNPDTTRTWVYTESAPIPPYCMVIAVGEGARLEPATPAATPLFYYVPQSDRGYAVRGFTPAAAAVSLFSEMVAPYPYEKLALIVGATRFGGMENSSAIVFPNDLFDGREEPQHLSRRFNIPERIEVVVAHEIAHQWFGDSVTERTWADLWLSEGFATYFAGLFIERFEGGRAFRDYMKRAAETYFRYEHERRAPIHDRDTQDLLKLLNPNNYEKGAWVLHMLRGEMGDDAFFRGIRDYYSAHRGSTATSEDLRAALEKSSGMDLREFFARWVYASGHPRYEVSWAWRRAKAAGGELVVRVRQLQDGEPFLTPLPAEVVTATDGRRITIKPTGRDSTMSIPLANRPTGVRIDPDEMILKEMVVRAPHRVTL